MVPRNDVPTLYRLLLLRPLRPHSSIWVAAMQTFILPRTHLTIVPTIRLLPRYSLLTFPPCVIYYTPERLFLDVLVAVKLYLHSLPVYCLPRGYGCVNRHTHTRTRLPFYAYTRRYGLRPFRTHLHTLRLPFSCCTFYLPLRWPPYPDCPRSVRFPHGYCDYAVLLHTLTFSCLQRHCCPGCTGLFGLPHSRLVPTTHGYGLHAVCATAVTATVAPPPVYVTFVLHTHRLRTHPTHVLTTLHTRLFRFVLVVPTTPPTV